MRMLCGCCAKEALKSGPWPHVHVVPIFGDGIRVASWVVRVAIIDSLE